MDLGLIVTRLRDRAGLAADRLRASDPGGFALRRAARGTLSFVLTMLLIWAASTLTAQPVMAMALGFPVSIFACVIVREDAARSRLIATGGLIAAAAISFSASALITNAWINHALFVALVFGVVYARRWGSRWMAAGFGAFVSFFFGAFLAPPLAGLPWHLLGLALATAAALLVQFVLLPHDAMEGLDRATGAIRQRLALLLRPLEKASGLVQEDDRQQLRSELHLLKTSIATAKAQLDATSGGWRTLSELSFNLFEVEAAAERLVRLVVEDDRSSNIYRHAVALRRWLAEGARDPLNLPPALNVPEEALQKLHDAVLRVRRAGEQGQSTASAAAEPEPAGRKPERQYGLSPDLRLALQTSAACALAVIGGELLSPQRWYWAVITVFVMFNNTSSRGDTLFKSIQRVIGTLAGVVAGIALVWLVSGDWRLELTLLPVTIFLTFYFFVDRYSVMVFFLTVMLALLYAVLDRFSPGILWLRLEETAVGATAGILVSTLLLPRATQAHVRECFRDLIAATMGLIDVSVERLVEGHDRSLRAHNRDFDAAYATMRESIEPLSLDRFGGGAKLYESVGDGLQSCSYWVHELGLAGRGIGGRVGDEPRKALLGLRDDLQRRLDRLRERVDAGETCSNVEMDTALEALSPPRSPDERVEIAMRALRNIAPAFDHVGEVVVSGARSIRFFRY